LVEGVNLTNFLIRTFIRDYQNTADSAVRERYGKFAGVVGIVSNFLLFFIKIVTGFLFGSVAIIADAVNNLSDSASSLITLICFKISGKPADKEHPFGHARMEYVAGLIISFIILFLGFQLLVNSVSKIFKPGSASFGWASAAVMAVAMGIKLWQFFFYRSIGKRISSSSLFAASMDSRNDVLASGGVLLGIVLSRVTGYDLDGYMGALVAVFILISGVRMVSDTISPLLGTAPSRELVDKIYEKILSYDGIIGLHDLAVHNYGVSRCFACVHCEVAAEEDIMVSHDIIDNIERDFLKDWGIELVIHLDPVVTSDPKVTRLKSDVDRLLKGISPLLCMHDFRVVWGVSHSNLIFDVVVPFDFSIGEEELLEKIRTNVLTLNEKYRCVVTVDHSFLPPEEHRENQK
jgi:cation diffusion facilitator family transporter